MHRALRASDGAVIVVLASALAKGKALDDDMAVLGWTVLLVGTETEF
jgi:hypothetical protein